MRKAVVVPGFMDEQRHQRARPSKVRREHERGEARIVRPRVALMSMVSVGSQQREIARALRRGADGPTGGDIGVERQAQIAIADGHFCGRRTPCKNRTGVLPGAEELAR